MSLLSCIFPCCFKDIDERYESIKNSIKSLTEEEKLELCKYIYTNMSETELLNTVSNQKGSGKKDIYVFRDTKISKLELKNTSHYIKIINIYDADTITGIVFFKGEPYIIKIRLSEIK